MTALPAPPEGLIVPDPADPRHLRRVLPAALDAAGVVLPPGVPGGDPAAARAGLGLPEVARVCVVLVDGLGAHNLDARGGHAPYLRRRSHDEASLRLTTCAPSTTAAAITTFGTGALPGATGMVGYEARDPARGTAMSLIAWEDTTLTPRSVQTVPTLAERAAERSPGARRPVSIGPARFVGSGLTEAALRGWEPRPAESLPQRVDATVAALREPAVAVTYLYWGDLDHAGHEHGWTSDAWVAELEHLDAELGRLARTLARLPGETLLLVTADHGMVDVERRHDLAAHPGLARDVALVTGDLRAPQAWVATAADAPGTAGLRAAGPRDPAATRDLAEQVAARWRAELDDAWVLTRDEVLASGLLGEPSPAATELLGDVVAFLGGRDVVVDSRRQRPSMVHMPGVHGSLDPDETTVPLLVDVI